MLKQRVITAVILAALVAWALFSWPDFWFASLLLVAGFACAWEWSALANLQTTKPRLIFSVLVTTAIAVFMWFNPSGLLKILVLITVFLWIAIVLDLYIRPVVLRPKGRTVQWSLLSVAACILVVTVVSLYWLRSFASPYYILFVVTLVAAADIGAYFTGRRFGVNKLAEKISAGKTIEGAVGGLLCAVVLSVLTIGNFSGELIAWWSLFLMAVVAALFSIVGDLFISRAKRTRGVKDSGHLLPGHGGVLDRFDGLLAAVPWMTFPMLWL